MAAQIADRSNAGMSFSSGDSPAPVSKLEATRLELAQEQKRRIDAAVARVTKGGKRKGAGDRSDAGHLSKKSKTVVDVASDQVDKKNSIARRMVDRFATMPEPEHEEEVEPTTRSVSTQQFVARSTNVEVAGSTDDALRETTQKVVVTTTTVEEVKVTEKKTNEEEEEEAEPAEEEEEKDESEKAEWDGPTTNFHVKQLGLDKKVDIYAPIAQQKEDVQRVRERAKYMPAENINTLKTASDSENDSDFAPKETLSQESEESDTVSLPEIDASETRELAEEAEEFTKQTEIQTAEIRRTWTKRVFVYTPLFLVAIIVLVFALLFAIDWSQETFQFCEVDAESAEGSEELFSCASFVETQSLVKSTLRETAEKVQETVQSYFE